MAHNLYPLDITFLTNDAADYSNTAIGMVQNHKFFSILRPTGFSIFLSIFYYIFGYKIIFPVTTLIIISTFLGIIAYFISLELFNDKTVALLSLILIIANPILIMQAPLLLSDTLALFFFALILFLSIKDYKSITLKYSIIIGFLIGVTNLIRPNYTIFVLIYLFCMLLYKNIKLRIKLKKIALFVIGFLIIMGPWTYYTYSQIGEPTTSVNAGIQFYIGNNPQATGWYTPVKITSNMTSEEIIGGETYKRGFNYLLTNTTSAAQLYIKKIYISIFEPYPISNTYMHGYNTITYSIVFIILNITFIITELFGLLGLISYRKNRQMFFFFSLIILSIYSTLIILFIECRYVMPLIFIFTIFGSYYIVKLYKNSIISVNEK